MAKGRNLGPSTPVRSPPTVADRLERTSYQIERYSPWYGFVERFRKLRVAAWTIRYWQAGPKFRWRLVRTTLAICAAIAAIIAIGG